MKNLLIICLLLVSFNLQGQTLYLTDQENYKNYLQLGGKMIPEVEFALGDTKNKLGSQFTSSTQIGVDQSKNYEYGSNFSIGCNDTSAVIIENNLPTFYIDEKIIAKQVNSSGIKKTSTITTKSSQSKGIKVDEKSIKDCSPKLSVATPSLADLVLFKQYKHKIDRISNNNSEQGDPEEDSKAEKEDEESEDEEDDEEDNNEQENTVTITNVLNNRPIIHFTESNAYKLTDAVKTNDDFIKINIANLKKNYLDVIDKNMPGFWLIHKNKYKVHTYYISLD